MPIPNSVSRELKQRTFLRSRTARRLGADWMENCGFGAKCKG